MKPSDDNIEAADFSAAAGGPKFQDWFKFQGRDYRIFKREDSRDASWYVHFQRRGRRYLRSLDTNAKETAIARARVLIEGVRSENWALVDGTKLKRAVACFGEVYQVYRQHADERKAKTTAGNIGALNGILRMVFGCEVDPEGLSTSVLSGQLVRQYKCKVEEGTPSAGTGPTELQRAKRSANSYLGQARSIFGKHTLEFYRDAGLVLPDREQLREFLEAPKFRGVGKSQREYNAPSDAVIAATFGALDALKVADPPAFLAICLAMGAALRKGEIMECRRSWFVSRNNRMWICGPMVTKNHDDRLEVPILSEWWARMEGLVKAEPTAVGGNAVGNGEMKRAEARAPDDFVLPGSVTERERVFRRIGPWMRSLGWKTEKAIHEFRAWVASKIADKYGIEAARQYLRHEDARTTQNNYGRYRTVMEIDLLP
jgi:integrase